MFKNVQKGYKRNLTPLERRILVEKLFKGANPLALMEENDISYITLRTTWQKWQQYLKLKRYFFHDEKDPYE